MERWYRNPCIYGQEKSDSPIVPEKPPNKHGDDKPCAEVVEERGELVWNAKQGGMRRTLSRASSRSKILVGSMSHGLLRVRRAAERDKSTRFTSLMHHITPDTLAASYRALKHDAAPGVDGCVWTEYGQKLQENLASLHMRMHSGSYRARPSLRVYIPKSDGTRRPLGIASVEDKILQHAASEVLSAIYEADFYGFSYGFRPKRGCHNALDALYVAIRP